MIGRWLPHIILRAASLLAPTNGRAEWLREWQSELWYVPRNEATSFCWGGFRDALWVRRSRPRGSHLDSPLRCIGFLTTLAAAGLLLALLLPGPDLYPLPRHLHVRDLPLGCVVLFPLTCLILLPIRIAMGPNRRAMPQRGRWRRWGFLTLKVALLHPVMLCVFLLVNSLTRVMPLACIGLAWWIWAIRWVLVDQRRRCPVCLHLLTDSVRIGTASRTLLEWYGAEAVCASGHGMLHSPEVAASHAQEPQWLELDDSWSSLFLEVNR